MYFIIILLLITLLSLLGILLIKIVKLHKTSFDLVANIHVVRVETETLFSQIQALLALERKLGLAQPLPPVRGWAGSPDFLLVLANQVLARKPSILVECSSGVSTIVAARCMQLNGQGHVYSLEHEAEYAAKTRALLESFGLASWATVLHAPLQAGKAPTPWYDDSVLPTDLAPIEMLVIDGPPQAVAPLARAPAFPRLRARMANDYLILADDADRPDEIEMVRQWQEQDPKLVLTRLPCEKGLAMLERDIA